VGRRPLPALPASAADAEPADEERELALPPGAAGYWA